MTEREEFEAKLYSIYAGEKEAIADVLAMYDLLNDRIIEAKMYLEEVIPQSLCLPDGIYDNRRFSKKTMMEILEYGRENRESRPPKIL